MREFGRTGDWKVSWEQMTKYDANELRFSCNVRNWERIVVCLPTLINSDSSDPAIEGYLGC